MMEKSPIPYKKSYFFLKSGKSKDNGGFNKGTHLLNQEHQVYCNIKMMVIEIIAEKL